MEISVFEVLIFMDVEYEIIMEMTFFMNIKAKWLKTKKVNTPEKQKSQKKPQRIPVTFLIKIPNIYHAFARFVICKKLLFVISSFVVKCC